MAKRNAKGSGHLFKRGAYWYIQATVGGKRMVKALGVKTEREAKEKVKEFAGIAGCETKEALAVKVSEVRKLKGKLSVKLADAWVLALMKPGKRQSASEKHLQNKKMYWDDFLAFMSQRHPKALALADVTRDMAEGYIQELRSAGKFVKQVASKRSYVRSGGLSPRSVNAYHISIAEVFSKLETNAGLEENPFSEVSKLKKSQTDREAFSLAELKLISDNLKTNPFVDAIFTIGACTGLREGDICGLRWSEVDLLEGFIRRRANKTGAVVDIPILPALRDFLERQRLASGSGEFVLPDHEKMYRENPTGIPWRFKSFLEGLDIKTTANGTGRSISIKDVHSLRHTFAYLAGVNGVPLAVVQSVLGHMSDAMTKHYQAHASREDKRRLLAAMPGLLSPAPINALPGGEDKSMALRQEVVQIIQEMDEASLAKLLQHLKGWARGN